VSPDDDSPLRVVVAEDSFLLRAGVVRVLEAAGLAVVGEAGEKASSSSRSARTGPTSW
jgi:AmiR/NasT family two-component response regulator